MINRKLLASLIALSAILLAAYITIPVQAASPTFVVKDEDNGSTISGNGGDTLTFSGAGFATTDDNIAIRCLTLNGLPYTGPDPVLEISPDPAGSGIFTLTGPVETTGGTYVLQAVGETSGLTATATFTVNPVINFDIDNGPAGTVGIQVTGNGFATDPLSDVLQATFGSTTITLNDLTNDGSEGNFQATFDVPAAAATGPYTVTITDSTEPSIHAQATFTVTSLSTLPEYPLGALVALIACFATFAVFKKRGSIAGFHLKL